MPFDEKVKWPRVTMVPGKQVYMEDWELERLTVDHSFQRKRDEWFCDELRADWEPSALGIFTLSVRSSSVGIILDGQHRQPVAIENAVRYVTCQAFYGLTLQEESEQFVLHNRMHTIRAAQLFAAEVISGKPLAVGVQRVVESCGCFIVRDPNNLGGRQIIAVKTLMAIYKLLGADTLAHTLQIINEAWPNDPEAMTKNIIRGIAHFLAIYSTTTRGMTEKRIVDMLKRTSAMSLNTKAQVWEEMYRQKKGDSMVHALAILWNDTYPAPNLHLSEEQIIPLKRLVREENSAEYTIAHAV